MTAGADTTVTSNNCYEYEERASDNVGNGPTTSGISGIAKVDNTPPTVTSINRAVASPSPAAATLSWTVTFSESVTGVAAGNFTLVNGGLGGTPAITTVTGSATTWTVSA